MHVCVFITHHSIKREFRLVHDLLSLEFYFIPLLYLYYIDDVVKCLKQTSIYICAIVFR